MLNEERIKLMTKMASYEANEGKKNVSIGSYFRGDYIGLQVVKSVLNATVAFLIVFAMFILSMKSTKLVCLPALIKPTKLAVFS